ncbi:fibrinogen-like protein A [Pomacea canaliculata]|uniref:fibrinogen-like protein A n=1 Tax=Pomacea canaliculata TaxID=400727 RepID=UPI000D729988|nr:fibrinogen-like protein A [Pomacea canaliculata]
MWMVEHCSLGETESHEREGFAVNPASVKGTTTLQTLFTSVVDQNGLSAIHLLTWSGPEDPRLRVELVTESGTYWAEYDYFTLYDPGRNYSLGAGGYSGTAGDAFSGIYPDPFQTYDRNKHSCVTYTNGPWWYKSDCASNANLFSPDKLYMTWADIGRVTFSEMKIKPN